VGATDSDATAFGDVETAVRADIEAFGDLAGVQNSLAQMAYRLARVLDSGARGMSAAAIARELRETLRELKGDADAGDVAQQLEAYLSSPVGDAAD
jgi:hypothetical protein